MRKYFAPKWESKENYGHKFQLLQMLNFYFAYFLLKFMFSLIFFLIFFILEAIFFLDSNHSFFAKVYVFAFFSPQFFTFLLHFRKHFSFFCYIFRNFAFFYQFNYNWLINFYQFDTKISILRTFQYLTQTSARYLLTTLLAIIQSYHTKNNFKCFLLCVLFA